MHLFKNKITDYLQAKCRKKRNLYFLSLIIPITKPLSILDVGGTVEFWVNTDLINHNNVHITLLNLQLSKSEYSNVESVVGDARNLNMFKDSEFDIVFSNSVIEHVGDFNDQMKMANEIMRVGKRFFIQTPYYWFPIEPHYRSLFFQLYPVWLKVYKLQHSSINGRYSKFQNKSQAINEANRIRLLNMKEMKLLFPGSNIYRERFLGLTKSIMAYKGFTI